MSIVVESVSAQATASATNTLTITKPTGLAEGDLMIASMSIYAPDGASASVAFNTKSGWSLATNHSGSNDVGMSIQYKIADASDVAASNFAFTAGGTADQLLGKIIRASGHNTLNPLGDSSVYTGVGANSATIAATHSAYTPAVDGALVVINFGVVFSTGSTNRTLSAYTTSGVTHTELYDAGGNDGSGGGTVAAAYGVQSTAAEISTYGATINTSTPDHYGQIAIFLPPVDASGENTLVATDTTLFSQTGACDGVGGNDLLATDTALFSQSGQATSPQQWQSPTKETTNWQENDI